MSLPKYNELMLPILKILKDSKIKHKAEVRDLLALNLKVSAEDRKELVPSGTQSIFDNRVGWAFAYLKKAQLVESKERAKYCVTSRGLETLKSGVKSIDKDYLMSFEEFREFQQISKQTSNPDYKEEKINITPLESLEEAFREVNTQLKNELLETIMDCSWQFFEKLVVDLLLNLGYGGSRKDAGNAFATTGDEGIDGVIKEDKLGLDVIYIQAKKWKKSSCVGRPEIQKFAGALQGKRAKKGVFLTTSYFSDEAMDFVKHIDSKIILIDGELLCKYMIESGTGVSVVQKYEIKRIDSDYFSDE